LIFVIAAATVVHWLILSLQLPAFTWITAWFWTFQVKHLEARWVLLTVVPAIATVPLLAVKGRYWLKVAALVIFGIAVEFGFGFSEGRGIEGIRERIESTGHAQFAVAAVRQPSILKVMRDYNHLVLYDEVSVYGRTKPPGQLLIYMFTQRLANRLWPRSGPTEQLVVLRTFASYAWPIISYLVLFPFFWLGKIIFDEKIGILACALYVFVPAVNLITLHTDQVFFPLFFVSCLLLAALSAQRRTLALAVVSGMVAYLAVYCSFGLAYVVPAALATAVIVSRAAPAEGGQKRYWPRAVVGFVLGFVVLDLVNRIGFNYDFWARYSYSAAHHIEQKGYEYNLRNVMYFGFSNLLEHMVWTGIPIYVLAWIAIVGSVRAAFRRKADTGGGLVALVLVALIASLVVFGRTSSEIARLWLFLVPVFCMLAAWQAGRRDWLASRWVVGLLVLLQWGTVFLTKHFQDFW
jgi:hypothetical protein